LPKHSWGRGQHVKRLMGAIVLAFVCIAPSVASAQCETQFVPPKRFPYYCNTSPQGEIDPACQRRAQQEYDGQVALARQNWQIQVAQCQAQEEETKRQAAQRAAAAAEADRQRAAAAAAEAERRRQAAEEQRRIAEENTKRAGPVQVQPPTTQTVTSPPGPRLTDADIERNNRPTVIVTFFVVTLLVILWFSRHAIRGAFADHKYNKSHQAYLDAEAVAERKKNEERAKIRAELPVVQSMTATVKVNGDYVHLVVNLSETEQAIIDAHALSQVVLDSKPKHTSDDIERTITFLKQPVGGYPSPFTSDDLDQKRREMRAERENTYLSDYLDPLFVKRFNDAGEALAYSDELKTNILPRIKTLIHNSMQHGGKAETFQI
jgi:hypothetical protein